MEEDKSIQQSNNMSEYSPKSQFSKPALIYKAFEKCIESRAKEMRKGYYNTTVTKDGLPIRSWVEDTRKVYCSAVHALRLSLAPELKEDNEFNEDDYRFNDITSNHSYHIYEVYSQDNKNKYRKTDKHFMPEVDAIVQVRTILPDGNETLVPTPGYWNKYIDSYWNHTLMECDKLYNDLMEVIHRLGYFKGELRY